MITIRAAGTAEVLAVLGHGDERPVAQTAEIIARLAGGQVRLLRLAADLSPGRAARQVIRALHQPGTVAGVLSGDEMSRPLWQRVAQQSVKPVVLVPAGARRLPRRIRRVLLPLDGTAQSAAAVAEAAERFARGGAELVVLHVFDRQHTLDQTPAETDTINFPSCCQRTDLAQKPGSGAFRPLSVAARVAAA